MNFLHEYANVFLWHFSSFHLATAVRGSPLVILTFPVKQFILEMFGTILIHSLKSMGIFLRAHQRVTTTLSCQIILTNC